MTSPVLQEDIIQTMKFIAGKAKNVKSPMSITELSRQFKEECGSPILAESVKKRIQRSRHEIHKMDEFDMDTKVKLMFALSAPIAAEFLIELKKHAEVEVDDKSRIIQYKKTGGGLELNGRHSLSTMQRGEKSNELLQFLAETSKTVNTPMAEKSFLKKFKAATGDVSTYDALSHRYRRLKKKIFQSSGFEKNTKIKMIFISSAEVPDDILEELRKEVVVEVDEEKRITKSVVEVDKDGKITKYKANDGSLELKGSHGMSSIKKSFYSHHWEKICQKVNDDESDEDDADESLWQKDDKVNKVELVKFLIDKTKNAKFPISIRNLAEEFKTEFDRSGPRGSIESRIRRIRQQILKMNQFDMHAKVKILFALSAAIDDDLLKNLQKDAIVELDEKQRIKKYKANDGSLELEGDHSMSAIIRRMNEKKNKNRVVDNSRDSDEDEKEEDRKKRKITPNKASSSLPTRKSGKIRKPAILNRDSKNADSSKTRNKATVSTRRKRARTSSSEFSEDEEPMTSENALAMDSETNRDHGGDDFDYDPPSYHNDNEAMPNKEKSDYERKIETPETAKDEEERASSSVKIETMSLLEFLTHLRPPIVQYTPTLALKIDDKIKQLEEKDKQIPYDFLIKSIELCIQILNTPEEMDSDEETISLSDFFYRLGMALLNIPHSSMDDFHVKMRKLATTGNKKVSHEHIRYAMENALGKILH